jgi:hypothetical protein
VTASIDWEKHEAETPAIRKELNLPEQVEPEQVDAPSCDCCGAEYSGSLKCANCQSIYYCSKKCQKTDWKLKHKAACPQMKENCERIALEVVQTLSGETARGAGRVEPRILEQLDATGSYQVAVDNGLHEAILQVMEIDLEQVQTRLREAYDVYFYTLNVMSILFRGGRVEGSGVKNSAFRSVDALRIKGFVRCDPRASDIWFQASLAIICMPFDDFVAGIPQLHAMVFKAARDVVAGWLLVFTSQRASRAILLQKDDPNDPVVIERAKLMAKRILKALKVRWSVPSERDTRSSIEGMLHQMVAMIHCRLKKYGVDIDFNGLMNFEGVSLHTHRSLTIPLAEGTIAKGGTLTSAELQTILAARRNQK